MYEITFNQCQAVSGGFGRHEARVGFAVVAALGGGYIASSVTSYFSPVATVISTVGGAALGGFAGTFCIPVPVAGTLIGAGLGALVGYVGGASFATLGAFGLGAVGTGYAAFAALA